MVTTFQGANANEVWQAAYDRITDGSLEIQPSRVGDTRELLHCVMSVSDPRQRWIASRVPPLNVSFAIAEIVWIMRARSDTAFLAHQSRSFPAFVGKCNSLSGAYGARLRHHFGIDQMRRAASALDASPESRQVVLQIWDAATDLPDADGTPASSDVPCNLTSILKVRGGKLEWSQMMRSNDLFRGLPYNIVQFTMLQEILAGWIGVEIGSYNQWSDSLHLYESDRGARHDVGIVPEPNGERIGVPMRESESAFAELERILEDMMVSGLTPQGLVRQVRNAQIPSGFRSLIAICGAEEARRRKWHDAVAECEALCGNPALRQQFDLWRGWLRERSERGDLALA